MSDNILRDIPGHDVISGCPMKKHLHGLRNPEPRFAMLKPERRHRVNPDTSGQYTQSAVNRRMRIAADNDLSRRPQSILDDHVVQTAVASVEQILDSMFRRKPSHLMQRSGGLLRCR